MTDQQTYTKDNGTVLLEVRPDWRSAKNGKLLIKLPIVSDHDSVVIPAAELLAMIDAADPDAMRGYLRETVTERPGAVASLDGPAADHFDYLDAVPEADSPEDIDKPDPVDQLRESGRQLGEAWRAFTEGVRAGTFGTDR